MSADRSGVVVTGIGARAAAGDHAVQIAASVRAGVSVLREWPGPSGPVVAGFTDPDLQDRTWAEKAPDLLLQPLAEALFSAGINDFTEVSDHCRAGRARVFLAMPYADRPGVDFVRARDAATVLGLELFGEGAPELQAVPNDRAAGAVAIAQAADLLQRGDADLCVVLGVDSLLEGGVLQALSDSGQLKTAEAPSGLVPGEAAAALVLETASAARRRKIPVLARIAAVALEREASYGPDAPASGAGLERAIQQAGAAAGGLGGVKRVLSDLNGERWRFLEWALAESRIVADLGADWQLWHPADCLGDVGAAFVPLATALAVRSFARGYAGGGQVLVLASAERGERTAMVIGPPGGA
jgi:3-oxoacyl-[acyl-carrier-protein] synthase-1